MSVRRVNVLFSTAGFNGGRKPCPKTRETAALRSLALPPSRFRTLAIRARVYDFLPTELPELPDLKDYRDQE